MILDVFEFETAAAPDAGGGGVEAAAVEPEAGAAAEASPDGAAAAPIPAEPAVDVVELQAQLEYQQQQLAQYGEAFQRLQPAGQTAGQDGPPDYDPFDPESVKAYMRWNNEQQLNAMREMLSPLSQTFEQQQAQQDLAAREEYANDLLDGEVSRNGEFVPGDTDEQRSANTQARELTDLIAANLYPQFAQRMGGGARAAEFAVEKAASQVRAMLKAAGQASVTQHQNHLATLAGATGEPNGVGGAATEQPVVKIGSRVVDRYAAA